jgi:hypothetical protein
MVIMSFMVVQRTHRRLEYIHILGHGAGKVARKNVQEYCAPYDATPLALFE